MEKVASWTESREGRKACDKMVGIYCKVTGETQTPTQSGTNIPLSRPATQMSNKATLINP